MIRINVELQLAVANVSANAYLPGIPGMATGTSVGFSMPYATSGYQVADVSYVTNVATTYSYQISLNAVTTAIATNGVFCKFSWIRIA